MIPDKGVILKIKIFPDKGIILEIKMIPDRGIILEIKNILDKVDILKINMVPDKGANIEIDNADVDVFIGEDIADKGASSQDDIMIGTWDSQAGSSGSGNGILVKTDTIRDPYAGDAVGSGKYDYIKLYINKTLHL